MQLRYVAVAAVAAMTTTACPASIPPAYQKHLPPEHVLDGIPFLSGGATPEEREAVKREAQEWPLEVVFYERDGSKDRVLEDMPVTITDAAGKVVFDGISQGPILLVKLPKGSYTVATKWDAWDFAKRVTLGDDRERVVFQWSSPTATKSHT